jgi:putative membrane protein
MQTFIAAVHLIAMALAMYGVLARGTALRETPTSNSLARAFRADAFWGIAALVLIVTGLYRLLGPIDKGTAYYMKNGLFHAKLTCIVLIIALEISPMLTLIRARGAFRSGNSAETLLPAPAARKIAMISHVQAVLLVVIVFLASAFARGAGAR